MKPTWLLAALFSVLLASITCASLPRAEYGAAVDESAMQAVPEFSIDTLDGTQITSGDVFGKVVLINFWATWCGPCKIEMPWFVEFQRKYKDRGFVVLAVSLDEDGWDPVREFAEEYEFNFPVLLGDEEVSNLFGGIHVLPTTLIVSQAGKIAFTHRGLVSKGIYAEQIEALLGAGSQASL